MKSLYIECNMGISGDMLMSALFGLFDNKNDIVEKINKIGLPKTEVNFTNKDFGGMLGNSVSVKINGEEEFYCESDCHHRHRKLAVIEQIIDLLNVTDTVKEKSKKIYKTIAEAESSAHGKPVEEVHFHEVGMLDAVADIVICSYLLELLDVDVVAASSVNVGNGTVKCAHGILSVPAPATALILQGIPYYKSDIQSELCTPTGAALLKNQVNYFGNMPTMSVNKISCGFGKKTFEGYNNCVRLFYGSLINDSMCELICNIDDMTPEALSYAVNVIRIAGAADVSLEYAVMKKERAGYILHVICSYTKKDEIVKLIFEHTSTLGIREYLCQRYTLSRDIKKVDTVFGPVRIKFSNGFGVNKVKIEYGDIAGIARRENMTFDEAKSEIEKQLFK